MERRVKEMWFGIGSARDRRTLEFENSVFDVFHKCFEKRFYIYDEAGGFGGIGGGWKKK